MPRFTIGSAAKSAGVSVDTVRFYERQGLLPAAERSPNGYRVYSAVTVERLRFIRKAKALGFTLEDIAELLRLQDGGGRRTQVRHTVQQRIEDLNRKLEEITALRDALVQLQTRCHGSGTLAGCPIIEGVNAAAIQPKTGARP